MKTRQGVAIMNIQELKKQADEEMEYQEKICTMQNEAITKFEHFFEVMDKSYILWNAKMKSVVDQFVADFKKYFKDEGFEIEDKCSSIQSDNYGEVIVTYKNLKFRLSSVNYDGEHMYIQNFSDITEEIWFALPANVPNYFVWKDNLVIGEKRLVDMNGPVKDVYKQFIEKFVTEDEIQQLMQKIEINVTHFQDAIDVVDSVELCIHRFCTDDTYKNFGELIEQIGN